MLAIVSVVAINSRATWVSSDGTTNIRGMPVELKVTILSTHFPERETWVNNDGTTLLGGMHMGIALTDVHMMPDSEGCDAYFLLVICEMRKDCVTAYGFVDVHSSFNLSCTMNMVRDGPAGWIFKQFPRSTLDLMNRTPVKNRSTGVAYPFSVMALDNIQDLKSTVMYKSAAEAIMIDISGTSWMIYPDDNVMRALAHSEPL